MDIPRFRASSSISRMASSTEPQASRAANATLCGQRVAATTASSSACVGALRGVGGCVSRCDACSRGILPESRRSSVAVPAARAVSLTSATSSTSAARLPTNATSAESTACAMSAGASAAAASTAPSRAIEPEESLESDASVRTDSPDAAVSEEEGEGSAAAGAAPRRGLKRMPLRKEGSGGRACGRGMPSHTRDSFAFREERAGAAWGAALGAGGAGGAEGAAGAGRTGGGEKAATQRSTADCPPGPPAMRPRGRSTGRGSGLGAARPALPWALRSAYASVSGWYSMPQALRVGCRCGRLSACPIFARVEVHPPSPASARERSP